MGAVQSAPQHMKAVIFAGGVGTRLWPLSRKKSPKQFEKIIGNQSTLQLAASRLIPDFSLERDIYISTGKSYVDIVHTQLGQIPKNHVIGEPTMRDVGPAVGLITAILAKESPDEPMVILWSDHLVKNEALFRKILVSAGELVKAHKDQIVFVAQKPRFASVNLGWIEYGSEIQSINGVSFCAFKDFQYRPNAETAQKYFDSGHHAWNLGYFVTTSGFLWKQYESYAPNLFTGLKKIQSAWGTPSYESVLESIYPTLEKISFDNAILEKLNPKQALVVSENIGWSDVGAWEALKEALQEAQDKNVTHGKVMLTDTSDSLVYNYTEQMLVTIDVDDFLVVNTSDVVMVCRKSSVPKIKKLVEGFNGTEHEDLV